MHQLPENTSVVLLAAGRGSRMRQLTDTLPKPLLTVGEHALIDHHLLNLAKLGFRHIVINVAYFAEKIKTHVGNGLQYGLRVQYSDESDTGALETAGGLKKALPLIKSDCFISINADIWSPFDVTKMLTPLTKKGRIALVDNPDHNPKGDFILQGSSQSLTFSGIAYYQKELFSDIPLGKQSLGPILKQMVKNDELDTIRLNSRWIDVGTPERLHSLNLELLNDGHHN